jgi:AcrR family transcriptional regulator
MARGLTKVGIVRAAIDLLDEAGLEGLTLRAVASRLGVKAPALYWHLSSKQDLLDEMGTVIWRQIQAELALLPSDLPWAEAMTTFANITRRTLLAHRDGANVFTGTYLTDKGVLESQEVRIARMMQQGFSLAEVVRGSALLYNFTIGFCIEEQAVAQAFASGDDRYSLRRREARLDRSTHPLAVGAGPEIFGDTERRFAEMVALIVDATGRMRGSG